MPSRGEQGYVLALVLLLNLALTLPLNGLLRLESAQRHLARLDKQKWRTYELILECADLASSLPPQAQDGLVLRPDAQNAAEQCQVSLTEEPNPDSGSDPLWRFTIRGAVSRTHASGEIVARFDKAAQLFVPLSYWL